MNGLPTTTSPRLEPEVDPLMTHRFDEGTSTAPAGQMPAVLGFRPSFCLSGSQTGPSAATFASPTTRSRSGVVPRRTVMWIARTVSDVSVLICSSTLTSTTAPRIGLRMFVSCVAS